MHDGNGKEAGSSARKEGGEAWPGLEQSAGQNDEVGGKQPLYEAK